MKVGDVEWCKVWEGGRWRWYRGVVACVLYPRTPLPKAACEDDCEGCAWRRAVGRWAAGLSVGGVTEHDCEDERGGER